MNKFVFFKMMFIENVTVSEKAFTEDQDFFTLWDKEILL